MKQQLFKRLTTVFLALVMVLVMLPAVSLPTFAWSWKDDGKFEVASYNAYIVEDDAITVDAVLDNDYLWGTKISSYSDDDPYFRGGAYGAVKNDGDGSFEAYVAVDTNGLYIWAQINDTTIFETTNTNGNDGDCFQIYFDWCTPDIVHPSPEELYEMYLLDGVGWAYGPYKSSYGVSGLQYIGWLSADYNGVVSSSAGFKPHSALGPDATDAVVYAAMLVDGGWTCEWFVPWRDNKQKEMIANGEQFHCGIGFLSSDDADIDNCCTPDKEESTHLKFDQRKELGLSYWADYSMLADLVWVDSTHQHEWVAQYDKVVEPKCTSYLEAYGYTDEKMAYGSMPYTCSICNTTKKVEIKPVSYHTWVEMEAEADTCEAIGHGKGSFCKWCKAGETASDVVTDVIKHVWTIDTTKEIKCPDCETTGYWTLKCVNCNTSYVHIEKATGHNYDMDNPTTYVEPTCTTWGYKLYGCTKCGSAFENETFAPLDHKWSEEGTKFDPNCTEAGRIVYTCTNKWNDRYGNEVSCTATNKIEDENNPALGHKAKETKVPAICIKDGYTLVTCETCLEQISYTILKKDPNGHTFADGVEAVKPTCTAPGFEHGICLNCGYTVSKNLPALGHDEIEVVAAVPATCLKAGVTAEIKCKRCEEVLQVSETYQDPDAHYAIKTNYSAATCKRIGYKIVACNDCSAVISYETYPIDPEAHTVSKSEYKAPTCDADGYQKGVCINCGKNCDKTFDMLGHDLVVVEGKAATCTEAGYTQRVSCNRCKKTIVESETIDALGHEIQIIYGQKATCNSMGITDGEKCLRCQNIIVKQTEIEKYDHCYNGIPFSIVTVVEPTCGENATPGYVLHECYYCGESYIDEYNVNAGHAWGDWIIVDPTCVETGFKFRSCINCGTPEIDPYSIVMPQGHKYSNDAISGEYKCEECDILLGDVSGDGQITNSDVLVIYRYIYNATLYPLDVELADVNKDGLVTNADVLAIYRYIYNPVLYPIG